MGPQAPSLQYSVRHAVLCCLCPLPQSRSVLGAAQLPQARGESSLRMHACPAGPASSQRAAHLGGARCFHDPAGLPGAGGKTLRGSKAGALTVGLTVAAPNLRHVSLFAYNVSPPRRGERAPLVSAPLAQLHVWLWCYELHQRHETV